MVSGGWIQFATFATVRGGGDRAVTDERKLGRAAEMERRENVVGVVLVAEVDILKDNQEMG